MRLFTAVLLPDEVRDHLDELGDRLTRLVRAETTSGSKGQVKWVGPETLHVTLKFLGEVDDAQVPELIGHLRNATKSAPGPFTIQADQIACLPPARRAPVRVIAASLSGNVERLRQTFATIEGACKDFGIPPEGRPFLPHITLARCRVPLPAFMRDELAEASSPGPWFDASQFAIVQSTLKPTGPEYRTIATFPAA